MTLPSLERWLETQRIGHLAYSLWSFEREDPPFDSALRALDHVLCEGAAGSQASKETYARDLPRGVLWLVEGVVARIEEDPDPALMPTDASVHEWVKAAHDAAAWLAGETASASRPRVTLHQVQAWAHHALAGTTSALWLLRLGKRSFGQSWNHWDEEAVLPKIIVALAVLRNPWALVADRCGAVDELLSMLPSHPRWIACQLRHALYHHQFGWPLFTMQSKFAAISLPVSIDIEFDGRPEENGLRLIGLSGRLTTGDGWARMVKCVEVGKKLWRAKHGHHGNMRDLVMSHTTVATIDFSHAESIVAGLSDLSDGSAEAYLAQAILGRLLGNAGLGSSTSTGAIGAALQDATGDELLNYSVTLPAGIKAKLQYAFASQSFERVVLPYGAELVLDNILGEREHSVKNAPFTGQSAEVTYVGDLHTMADVMHGQSSGWRQHRYVRAPDIRALVHPGRRASITQLSEPTVSEVERAVAFLQDPHCNQTVRIWTGSTSALALALKRLNGDVRTRIRPKVPPTLSWAFVRSVDYENGISFWRTLWHTIGASRDSFSELLLQHDAKGAAGIIGNALNVFSPSRACPSHRAPDILVIVNSDAIGRREGRSRSPSARPFALAPIVEALQVPGALACLPNEALNALIGGTRIVFVPVEDTLVAADLSRLGDSDTAVLRDLATFRSEFTQAMAAGTLYPDSDSGLDGKVPNVDIRALLSRLKKDGLLSNSAGKYYFSREMRSAIEQRASQLPESPLAASKRLYRAAQTLAPYISRVTRPSVAMDMALAPENIHEARSLLKAATDLAQRAGNDPQASMCHSALKTHTLFTAFPTWATVDSLVRSKDSTMLAYAYECALELLDAQESVHLTRIHPGQLRSAARATALHARRMAEPARARLEAEAAHLFERSLSACGDYPDECIYNSAVTRSYYCADLLWYTDATLAIAIVRDLCVLLESKTDLSFEGLAGEAFELAGDSICDSEKDACYLYRWGCKVAPTWGQLWPKAIGAAFWAGDCASLAELMLEVRKLENWALITSKGREKLTGDNKKRKIAAHVWKRAELGLRLL